MSIKKMNVVLMGNERGETVIDTGIDNSMIECFISTGYAQLSEVTEIELKLFDNETVTDNKLNALDQEEQKLDAEYLVRKNDLEGRRQSLLCLENKAGE